MRDYRSLMGGARRGTTPDDARLAAVEAAAAVKLGRRAPTSRWAIAAPVAFALAAAVFFALRGPVRVDRPLDDAGAVSLGAEVAVTSVGRGAVVGTDHDMVVAWTFGTLAVEVQPQRGVSLVVETDEGRTSVVGTGFSVTRDALGTTTAVTHGRVRVECQRGGERFLAAGESRTCPPVTAAGALGRLLVLDGTVAPEVLLAEIAEALALPDATGAVAAELAAMRVRALVQTGRLPEALAAAEAALADPACTRADELRRVAEGLRVTLGGGATAP